MHGTSRCKPSALSIFIFALLSITLIATLPRNVAAQSENTWELKIPKTSLANVYGVVSADGKIYVYQDSFFCYDPSTGSRTEKAPLKIPFEYDRKGDYVAYTAVTLQNEIYVIGGAHSEWRKLDFTFIRIYNIADNSWRNGTATNYDIEFFPIANVVDGKIYLLDGRSGRLGVFDPSSNSWTTKTPLPIWYLSAETVDTRIDQTVVVNDRIYCFTATINSPPRMIIYDTKTDQWLPGTNPPITKSQDSHFTFACATTGHFAPQRIYYIGAAGDYPPSPAFSYVYDPANDSWSNAQPLSISTLGYDASTVLNDKIYYFAVNGSSVEVYTPLGYSATPLPPSPSPIYPQANPIPKTNPLIYTHLAIVAITIVLSIILVTIYLRRSKARKALPIKNKLP
jgi:hypothetical protein